MCSSSGISRLRLLDGRASKSRLPGQFDKAFMPLNRARFGLVQQEASRWGNGRRPSPQTAAGLAYPAAPFSMMAWRELHVPMQPNHRQQERAIVFGSKAIFTRSEFIGIAVPCLQAGALPEHPRQPPPVLTVRWLECVVGNVDYYSTDT